MGRGRQEKVNKETGMIKAGRFFLCKLVDAPRSGEEEKLKKNRTKNSKMVSDSSATLDFIEIL